jgi:nucleoside-diphosphate-sugar epimerase
MSDLADCLVCQARDLFGYRGTVIRQMSPEPDYLADNPQRRCPSINKARSELGFNPEVSLGEGLRRSLIWYRDNREAEEA